MHALSLLLVAAATGLAQAAQTDPSLAVTKAFVQFPASFMTNQWATDRNNINGYVHIAREQCLNLCGHEIGAGNYCHHMISVIPTRIENVAETSCWCCVKDPKGNCYSQSNPYNATAPWGDWVDETPKMLAKLASKSIGPCTTVSSQAVNQVKPVVLEVNTAVPTPGKAIQFHWDGPKSEIGGVYYAYFIDSNKNVAVKKLNNNACIFPSMTGKIAVTVSAAKDPKAPSTYIVARTTLTIGGSSKRLRRALKSKHAGKRNL